MHSIFLYAKAHQTLTWTLYLLPLFLVWTRGAILDNRALKLDAPSRYHPLIVVGFFPLINIPIALLVIARTIYEMRTQRYFLMAKW